MSVDALTQPINTRIGSVIEGRYQLREKLGEGGFAEVYDSTDTKLGRRVAVKILKDTHQDEKQREVARERFFREARFAAQISHPDVVTIFDYGEADDGSPYIVLEYLSGKPLSRELWLNGPMDPERAYNLFGKCVHALAAAHERGVIHRDLKPSNLMIVHEGTRLETVRVLDFGIAFYFSDAHTRLTMTGQFLGTPEYVAPEYVREQQITPALDVYQLGLIFIEMLIGKPLVAMSKPLQCLFAHCNGYVEVPKYLQDSPLGPILEKAVMQDVHHRYQNAGALLRELDKLDPKSIPKIPSYTSPEELVLVRDWSDSEVDNWSQTLDALPAIPAGARAPTPMFEPEQHIPTNPLRPQEPAILLPTAENAPPTHTPRAAESKLGVIAMIMGVVIVALLAVVIGLLATNDRGSTPGRDATISATAPPTPSKITLTTSPSGVAFVDAATERVLGNAPLELELTKGARRRLMLKLDGHKTTPLELDGSSPDAMHIVMSKEDPTPPAIVATPPANDAKEAQPAPPTPASAPAAKKPTKNKKTAAAKPAAVKKPAGNPPKTKASAPSEAEEDKPRTSIPLFDANK